MPMSFLGIIKLEQANSLTWKLDWYMVVFWLMLWISVIKLNLCFMIYLCCYPECFTPLDWNILLNTGHANVERNHIYINLRPCKKISASSFVIIILFFVLFCFCITLLVVKVLMHTPNKIKIVRPKNEHYPHRVISEHTNGYMYIMRKIVGRNFVCEMICRHVN